MAAGKAFEKEKEAIDKIIKNHSQFVSKDEASN